MALPPEIVECTTCVGRLARRDGSPFNPAGRCCGRCAEGWHNVACGMRQVALRMEFDLPNDPQFSVSVP